MAKNNSHDGVARLAAEIATKTAIDIYAKEKQREKKRRADRRLRDTKRLLKNYREIKIHAGDAIASLAEVKNEDFDFFHSIMEDESSVDVTAIVQSKARSAIMLTHIDAMLEAYQVICFASAKPEEQRRYRILESTYLCESPDTIANIAKCENIDERTVYRDLDAAYEKMSALLFGIQWIERE